MTGVRDRLVGAPVKGRFAPSPTGRMHAGNIFAYLMAWLNAKSRQGDIVLRIEDLDVQRSRPEYADAIMYDLERLGLTWDEGPYRQSDRSDAYAAAFDQLRLADAVYPCFCTRTEAVLSAPHLGEGGGYAGTCRHLSDADRRSRTAELSAMGRQPSFRLKMPDGTVCFHDAFQGLIEERMHAGFDDPVVRRADGLFAYQLAVVVDDAAQGITSVIRGFDLLPSVKKQMRLISLLEMDVPSYGHIPLLVAEDGRRLAKRDADAAVDAMVARLGSPAAVIGRIAFLAGITDVDEPATPEELLAVYDEERLQRLYEGRMAIPFACGQDSTT